MTIRFSVADWMAIAPGRSTRDAWIAWANGGEPAGEPAANLTAQLPSSLRRRVTPIGQAGFAAAHVLGADSRHARIVFCSRHGEFSRTLALLQALAADEPLSPADFSLSVHNALLGLLSIAWKNSAGHSSIAAGPDSFTVFDPANTPALTSGR